MAVFADEAEVYEYLGGVFRIGMADPDLVAKLQPSGVVLRITYTNPDAVLTVDMPNSEIHTGAGQGPDPNIELFMSADTGNRFWLGNRANRANRAGWAGWKRRGSGIDRPSRTRGTCWTTGRRWRRQLARISR